MIELKSVTWSNFLSYGDYETTVDFTNLNQCLITGLVVDDIEKDGSDESGSTKIIKSNGAGKSTIVNAINWGLFGRTMHSDRPGNKIMNWFTGKNCCVRLEFKNGDFITRIRTTDGTTELLFGHEGDECKYIGDTISTADKQQKQLASRFGLDYEVFCGSAFFNQYNKPWMEMADQSRKKVMERLLHIDRIGYYAKVAKSKIESIDQKIEVINNKIISLANDIESYTGQINRIKTQHANFDKNRELRKESAIRSAEQEKRNGDRIQIPDIDAIKNKWAVLNKISGKLSEYRSKASKMYSDLSDKRSDLKSVNVKIASWKSKQGKICMSCEQEVQASHVDTILTPYIDEQSKLTAEITELELKYKKITEAIKTAEDGIAANTPEHTIADVENLTKNKERHNKDYLKYLKQAEDIAAEVNPHSDAVSEYEDKIVEANNKIIKFRADIEEYTAMNIHCQYIHRAYNDRNKIKSLLFEERIPFINSRLKHYLDVFGLDIGIELTSSLSVTSNLWGYEFESGGERKRTDVAMMLAMFDFHEQMYGRQCNVLVLDEVDGRLDDDGIDSLVNIIKCDLAPRVESILIISHKSHMKDVFPSQILIKRVNRFSQVEEIIK